MSQAIAWRELRGTPGAPLVATEAGENRVGGVARRVGQAKPAVFQTDQMRRGAAVAARVSPTCPSAVQLMPLSLDRQASIQL